MSAARTAPTTQRMIWETGRRRSNEGLGAVSALATGGCYDGNERAGQDRPSRVLGLRADQSYPTFCASTNFHGGPLASAWKIEMRPPSGSPFSLNVIGPTIPSVMLATKTFATTSS